MTHKDNLISFKKHIDSRDDAVALDTQDFMGDGVLCRVLPVPAGFSFIGKLHKTKHVFAVISGVVGITDENGDSATYEAPYFMECEAGTQRTIVAITDVILMNAHAADTSLSIEEIEDSLVTTPFPELTEDIG